MKSITILLLMVTSGVIVSQFDFCSANKHGTGYMGCYIDHGKRDLNGVHKHIGRTMTRQSCHRYCESRKYRYYGLQAGDWCFCGNRYGVYGKAPDSQCSSVCHGNRQQICGGGWRNSVYPTGYMGCYIDHPKRDLSGTHMHIGITMTPQLCQYFCAARNFKIYGLQAGDWCFCGNHYGTYGKAPDSQCSSVCHGNRQQKCGGGWRNSVYLTRIRSSLGEKAYKGCYIDHAKRDLNGVHKHAGKTMTRQSCHRYCESRRYRYYGLQAGDWCFCGNRYGVYGKAPDSQCSSECHGNKRQTCGGRWRNSVYATGYLGCYIDHGKRDLNGVHKHIGRTMTRNSCRHYCKSRKYRYYGLQAGDWCFCGNRYGIYGKAPESQCSSACHGNKQQKCGGGWRNGVYDTAISEPSKEPSTSTETHTSETTLCVDPYTKHHHKLNSRWMSKHGQFCFHYYCHKSAKGPERVDCQDKQGRCVKATKHGKEFKCKEAHRCRCLKEGGNTYIQQEHYEE